MMTRDTSELLEELDKLSPKQKSELARTLTDSLHEDLDENVELLWHDEGRRLYGAYPRGETSSRSVRRNLHESARDSGAEPPFPRPAE